MVDFKLNDGVSRRLIHFKVFVDYPVKHVNSNPEKLSFYNNWYRYKKQLYYHKKGFIFEELFMKELSNAFGLNCVDFFLAYNDMHQLGIASENFRTFDKTFYDYFGFINSINPRPPLDMDLIELYNFIKSNPVYKKLLDIFSLIAMDIFSGQTDRHSNNVIIEVTSDGPYLAPLTDNGIILEDLDGYNSAFGRLFLCTSSEIEEKHIETFEALLNIPQLFDKLSSSLDIDVSEYIDMTCDKHHVRINDYDRENILYFFERKKRIIDNTLSLTMKLK